MSVKILGVRINTYTKSQVFSIVESFIRSKKPHLIWTANVDHLIKLTRDGQFRDIYEAADLVMADGMPLVWVSRLFGSSLPERVTGIGFLEEFAPIAEKRGYIYFFLGGNEATLDKAKDVLQENNPNLRIFTYAPSYSELWSKKENDAIVSAIKKADPDILFVGVGAPKQEKWIYRNLKKLNVPVAMGVGGAFEMVAGVKKRAPYWMQHIGLEWLFRLIQDPRRLWKRYAQNLVLFPYLILREQLLVFLSHIINE